MQVTSKLVKAAEALLRGALEPLTTFAHAEGQHIILASQASPRKGLSHVSDESSMQGLQDHWSWSGLLFQHLQHGVIRRTELCSCFTLWVMRSPGNASSRQHPIPT